MGFSYMVSYGMCKTDEKGTFSYRDDGWSQYTKNSVRRAVGMAMQPICQIACQETKEMRLRNPVSAVGLNKLITDRTD